MMSFDWPMINWWLKIMLPSPLFIPVTFELTVFWQLWYGGVFMISSNLSLGPQPRIFDLEKPRMISTSWQVDIANNSAIDLVAN